MSVASSDWSKMSYDIECWRREYCIFFFGLIRFVTTHIIDYYRLPPMTVWILDNATLVLSVGLGRRMLAKLAKLVKLATSLRASSNPWSTAPPLPFIVVLTSVECVIRVTNLFISYLIPPQQMMFPQATSHGVSRITVCLYFLPYYLSLFLSHVNLHTFR